MCLVCLVLQVFIHVGYSSVNIDTSGVFGQTSVFTYHGVLFALRQNCDK